MEKARVKKGKKYWYVSFFSIYGENGICADWDYENFATPDNTKWAEGNYFHTQEEAELMAKKIRKVLNGADVIEMPSEEETTKHVHRVLIEDYLSCDRGRATFSEGCIKCYEWLKSKIVK